MTNSATAPVSASSKAISRLQLLFSIGPIVGCVLAARFGWVRGHDLIDSLGQAAGFGIASLMVGYLLILVVRCWKDLRPLAYTFAAMWGLAVVAETIAHAGILSVNNANVANAATTSKASYETGQNAIKAAEADVRRLQGLVDKPLAISAGQAQGDIDYAKAHKFWASTRECAETKGDQTRAFCAKFFAARSALEEHQTRSKITADLAAAQERLAQATTKGGGIKVVTAAADEQAATVAKYAFFSLRPSSDAVQAATLGTTLLLALIFVSFGIGNAGLWWMQWASEQSALTAYADARHVPAKVSVPNHPVGVSVPLVVANGRAPDSHALKTLGQMIDRSRPTGALN